MSATHEWRTMEDSEEQPLLAWLEAPTGAADVLRVLADKLDADEELCLIGLWVMPDTASYVAGTAMQVALTRLAGEQR